MYCDPISRAILSAWVKSSLAFAGKNIRPPVSSEISISCFSLSRVARSYSLRLQLLSRQNGVAQDMNARLNGIQLLQGVCHRHFSTGCIHPIADDHDVTS